MLASGYLVFFLCALVGSSLFFVVTLQLYSPAVPSNVKPRRLKRRTGNPTPTKEKKRAPVKKRKRKRKIQETPVRSNIIQEPLHVDPVQEKTPEPPIKLVPDIPPLPEPVKASVEEEPVSSFPPKKSTVEEEEKALDCQEEKIINSVKPSEPLTVQIPPIERLASTSVEPKSEEESEFDYLLDAKESESETLSNKCLEMDRDRSKSDSNLLSKASSKRKPPLVYNNPPYSEKNLREQKKQKVEEAETEPSSPTVSKASPYTAEPEMNQSPSPPGGESSSSDSSAKTTESFEKERGSSAESTPTRTANPIPPSYSNSQSNSTVKRSLSTRSLPSHTSPRRHYSRANSHPNSPMNSNMQPHRSSRRRLRKQSKKKHRGPSRSYSHSHLNHVHHQHQHQHHGFPPQHAQPMRAFAMPQFTHQTVMQPFVHPPPPQNPMLFNQTAFNLEFDQNSVLHPLQQIKDPGPTDVGVGHQPQIHFMPSQHQIQPHFIMTEIQQPHIPIVHQPQLPSPQPLSPQVVLQHVPMSPMSSGGLSQVSLNSIASPAFYQIPQAQPPFVMMDDGSRG